MIKLRDLERAAEVKLKHVVTQTVFRFSIFAMRYLILLAQNYEEFLSY